jgi:hypothetical protein
MKPQLRPEQGQHWRDANHAGKAVRRIVDASDPWKVEMEHVVTGKRTKVFRVSEWGRPTGYEFVPKSPEMATKEDAAKDEVHIRFSPGEGPRLTYCLKKLDAEPGSAEPELITTTLANLSYWRKRRAICKECDRRREDGLGVLGEIARTA